MIRYLFILLGLLSRPLLAETNVVYLEPGASIPAAVALFGIDGGTIYLSEGTYTVGAGSPNGSLVISQAPVTLVGAVGPAGAPTSIIELKPGSLFEQDVAIMIADYAPRSGGNFPDDHPDLLNVDRGSNSEIRNVKITVEAGANESHVGGIEIDGAEFVVIDNVHIDGFGDSVRDIAYNAMGTSPFAIKIHTSALAGSSTFDCADWLKINNTKLTNNYRGFVATGCSNGFITGTYIENTGPGAGVYIERKGEDGGSTFKFLDSTIQSKVPSSGSPADKQYLVYLTTCTEGPGCADSGLKNTNASFMNSVTDVSGSGASHFYINSGQNQLFNHSFRGAGTAIDSLMEFPPDVPLNPVKRNIVGPHTRIASASINMITNRSRNHVWISSQDIDGDGFYASDDLDDDNDTVVDGSDNCLVVSNANQTDTDSDNEGNACDSDDDNDSVVDGSDAYPLISVGAYGDNDADGAPNVCDAACEAAGMIADNCTDISNPLQQDSDAPEKDGYGNACDGDLNNDNLVNTKDLRTLSARNLLDWVNTATGKIPATTVPHIKPESEIKPSVWYGWMRGGAYQPGNSGLSCAGISTPCPAP